MLVELSPDFLASVMHDFSPPSNTQNINAKLHAFVRRRTEKEGVPPPATVRVREREQLHQQLPPLLAPKIARVPSRAAQSKLPMPAKSEVEHEAEHDEVAEFVASWGFDVRVEDRLRQLTPDQQAIVLQEFNPGAQTMNINGKLTAFIRSVEASVDNGFNEEQAVEEDSIDLFAKEWNLDDGAINSLKALSPEMQDRVMADFNPPPGTRNIAAKFTSFIRAKTSATDQPVPAQMYAGSKRKREEDPVDVFVQKYCLDEAAESLVRELPEGLQADVMRDFHPRSDTFNFSGKLHAFVRKRLEEGHEGRQRGSYVSQSRDPIPEFCDKWGLDDGSEALLRSLPEDMQAHVVVGFEPNTNTRNPNAKLATWIRSLHAQANASKTARLD